MRGLHDLGAGTPVLNVDSEALIGLRTLGSAMQIMNLFVDSAHRCAGAAVRVHDPAYLVII